MQVIKRNKTQQPFNVGNIRDAITKAWIEVNGIENDAFIRDVVSDVISNIPSTDSIDVENVQDIIEISLMRNKAFDVAKAYILYREKRTELRKARQSVDPKIVSDYIHASKYARYLSELKRRESYHETVTRVENMMLKRFGVILEKDIKWAFQLVRDQRVVPSMRAMQFAGPAIEHENWRIYNCTATHIDRMDVFSEIFYLLLCGCGVGFSVQFDHVEKLPELQSVNYDKVVHHVVADSILGWANAAQALVDSYVKGGYYVEFSYAEIRPKGSILKTSGGRAPGHLGLKKGLDNVRVVLDAAQGRKLRPAEAHHIVCHLADAVLSGGIRRSSLLSLFSYDDGEMMNLKTGDWFNKAPWLSNANNSVALIRDAIKYPQFKRIFEKTRQWGEPGFEFIDNVDVIYNPCSEIGLNPKLQITPELSREYGASVGDEYTGFQPCNLTEINGARLTSIDAFMETSKAAALIGTLQAAFTKSNYLGWVSEELAKREALLGVSITGMLDSPTIALDPDYQREAAGNVNYWNAHYAKKIGINIAARTTCVKPSGTTSLLLGCSSGHHGQHARRYIRRVTANDVEPVFQYFKKYNPHMCVRKPNGDWVVEFPREAPANAILRDDWTAIEFLERVKQTQQNWVLYGIVRTDISPGWTHNVSNTCNVKPHEWAEVADYLWENREYFSGVSFIPHDGDKKYAFAPNEALTSPADEAHYNELIRLSVPVDYSQLVEEEDGTVRQQEPACANGVCEL